MQEWQEKQEEQAIDRRRRSTIETIETIDDRQRRSTTTIDDDDDDGEGQDGGTTIIAPTLSFTLTRTPKPSPQITFALSSLRRILETSWTLQPHSGAAVPPIPSPLPAGRISSRRWSTSTRQRTACASARRGWRRTPDISAMIAFLLPPMSAHPPSSRPPHRSALSSAPPCCYPASSFA